MFRNDMRSIITDLGDLHFEILLLVVVVLEVALVVLVFQAYTGLAFFTYG